MAAGAEEEGSASHSAETDEDETPAARLIRLEMENEELRADIRQRPTLLLWRWWARKGKWLLATIGLFLLAVYFVLVSPILTLVFTAPNVKTMLACNGTTNITWEEAKEELFQLDFVNCLLDMSMLPMLMAGFFFVGRYYRDM